jgi:tRNA(fMet)-specific endonuclease VapC
VILDTNAYSAFAVASPVIAEVIRGVPDISLPLPVIAELRFGFIKGNKQAYNEHLLQKFLAQPQATVLKPTLETTRRYADLQLWCKKRGRALSNNDIWIAALAQEANDTLVTFDRDFDVFADLFGDKLMIL